MEREGFKNLERSVSTSSQESPEGSPSPPGRLSRMLSMSMGSPDDTKKPKKMPSPGRLTRLFQSIGRKQIDANKVENGTEGKAANAFALAIAEAADEGEGPDGENENGGEETEIRSSVKFSFTSMLQKKRARIASQGAWKVMRSDIQANGRKHLEAELLANSDNPNLSMVVKLGHICLDKKHHSSDAAYSGALLFEWAHFRGFELNFSEKALLARAHAEIWQSRGLAAEEFHLHRARILYDETLKADPERFTDSITWLDCVRVLLASGASEEALSMLQYMITTFEGNPETPNWLFYIGATLKAKGLHDEAANFLFEAASSGPPRFFSKLDMMFIISRNIEEEGTKKGEPNEEAYEMVFQHLQLEGKLSEELTYEQWLHDSNTWRLLADKCALHGMFSLATDLYAQGLMKDLQAFKKPKLWFGFAKSCHRCKRDSDARLAIKQALTMDPYNQQLIRADDILSSQNHDFEEYMEKNVSDIIDRLHKHHDKDHQGASKLQAMFKGKSERKGLLHSVGSRTDGVAKKLQASRAVLLGGKHPTFLHAKASWLGTVNSITATDPSGNKAVMMLDDPFTPIKELSSMPRQFELKMTATPDEESSIDRHVVMLRFEDQQTNEFIQRSMTLSFREHDKYGRVSHLASRKNLEPDSSTNDDIIEKKHVGDEKAWALVDCLRFKDTHDTLTDIAAFEVEKGAITFMKKLYFYHVRCEDSDTIFEFMNAYSGDRMEILMPREHLDRCQNLAKAAKMLLSICQSHPDLRKILFGLPESVAINSTEQDAHTVRENMKSYASKGFIPIHNTENRVAVNIKDADINSRGGLVVHFSESSKKAIISGHTEKVVAHEDRPLTRDEKAAAEFSRATHSMIPTLRRAKSRRKSRREVLKKSLSDDPTLFDLDGIEAESTKDVGSAEVSVSSGMRDVYVPGMDDPKKTLHTDLKLTANVLKEPSPVLGMNDPGKSLIPTDKSKKEVKLMIASEGKKDMETHEKLLRASEVLDDMANAEDKVERGDDTQDDVSMLSIESHESEPQNVKSGPESPKHENKVNSAAEVKHTLERMNSMEGESIDGDNADSDDEGIIAGTSGKSKKEERRLARKKAMKAKLEKSQNAVTSSLQFDEEDEDAKKKERERKKKEAREKMMAERAKMEALAKERKRAKGDQVDDDTDAVDESKDPKANEGTGKKKRKQTKKVAIDAAVFLKHQEARSQASEYLLERAKVVRRQLRLQETTQYLKARSNAAKLEALELEQEMKADAARKENEERLAKSKMGKFGKKMSMIKKGSRKLLGKLKGRGKDDDEDASTAGEPSVTSESVDGATAGNSADAGADLVAEDSDVSALESADKAMAEADEALAAAPPEVEVKEVPETEEEKMERLKAAVLAEAAKKPKKVVLSRYPVFVKPKVKREPVKIDMFQKPTLSLRQQHNLRRPMSPSDLPQEAFQSAEGLLSALRAYYHSDLELREQSVTTLDKPETVPVPTARASDEILEEGGGEGKPETKVEASEETKLANSSEEDAAPAEDAKPEAPASTGGVPTSTEPPSEEPVAEEKSQDMPAPAPAPAAMKDVMSATDALKLVDSIITSPIKPPKGAALPYKPTPIMTKPLPINAMLTSSLFQEPSLTSVSVIQDSRVDGFQTRRRQMLKTKKKNARLNEFNGGGSKSQPLPTGVDSLEYLEGSSSHPFDPERHPNSLKFLEPGLSQDSFAIGRHSVDVTKSKGYPDNQMSYSSYWRDKLMACAAMYRDGTVLRKALFSMLKLCPQRITKLEAFCALSDAEGSQIEALGRLADPEFLREVKLVCSLLPVMEILAKKDGTLSHHDIFEGGARAASPATATRKLDLTERVGLSKPGTADIRAGEAFDSFAETVLAGDSPNARAPNRLCDNRTLKAMQHLVSNTTPTLFETRYMQEGPSASTDFVVSAGLQGTASTLRIHTTTAETILPHMNMSQESPIVQSRGTSIAIKHPAPPLRQFPSADSFTDLSAQHESLSGVEPGEASPTDLSPIKTNGGLSESNAALSNGFSRGMAASGDSVRSTGELSTQRGYIESSSHMSFNVNRSRVPKTEGNQSFTNILTGRLDKANNEKLKQSGVIGGSVGGLSSLAGSVDAARIMPPSKSVRLSHVIDTLYENSPAKMVVMARKDALRAAEEETLSRSSFDELREKALSRSQRMQEIRTAKAFGLQPPK